MNIFEVDKLTKPSSLICNYNIEEYFNWILFIKNLTHICFLTSVASCTEYNWFTILVIDETKCIKNLNEWIHILKHKLVTKLIDD